MRENGEFVQVAVQEALTQLVQNVVEKLLVTAVYLFKVFCIMKEVNHVETKNLPPRYLAHLSCVNFKNYLYFFLRKITDFV